MPTSLVSTGVQFPDNTIQTTAATGGATTKTWTSFTSSGTYTVPSGVTSIRVYAIGRGANAVETQVQPNGTASPASVGYTPGSGGGCAFGDLAVTSGTTVTITISGGVATVTYAGVTRFTANPGAVSVYDSGTGTVTAGIGGSATIHASVTNGNAFKGGNGSTVVLGGAGASAGSPAGVGVNATSGNTDGGRSPIGSHGATATVSSSVFFGAGLPATPRAFLSQFTDPLLLDANGAGGLQMNLTVGGQSSLVAIPPQYGGGGGAVATRYNSGGQDGASFGGGGGGANNTNASGASDNPYSRTASGGTGGILAGGGAATAVASVYAGGSYIQAVVNGGNGGFGGGGGGGYAYAVDTSYTGSNYAYFYGGTGGAAIVLIYA